MPDATPDHPLENDAWSIDPYPIEIDVHPRYLVDQDSLTVLALFQHWRAGGFGGGPLPAAGGALEQAACVMDAMAVIGEAWAKLERKEGKTSHE